MNISSLCWYTSPQQETSKNKLTPIAQAMDGNEYEPQHRLHSQQRYATRSFYSIHQRKDFRLWAEWHLSVPAIKHLHSYASTCAVRSNTIFFGFDQRGRHVEKEQISTSKRHSTRPTPLSHRLDQFDRSGSRFQLVLSGLPLEASGRTSYHGVGMGKRAF